MLSSGQNYLVVVIIGPCPLTLINVLKGRGPRITRITRMTTNPRKCSALLLLESVQSSNVSTQRRKAARPQTGNEDNGESPRLIICALAPLRLCVEIFEDCHLQRTRSNEISLGPSSSSTASASAYLLCEAFVDSIVTP